MSLEKKRKELELKKVETARLDMEFKIEERYAEIERLRENIDIQKKKEVELVEQIKEMEDK